MYGLTADVDLSFLVGAELLQVAAGQNEVILNFFGDVSIMIAADLRLSRSEHPGERLSHAPSQATTLIRLLGLSVLQASGADGTLRLELSDGSTLEVYDSWPNYESYTITHRAGLIVV